MNEWNPCDNLISIINPHTDIHSVYYFVNNNNNQGNKEFSLQTKRIDLFDWNEIWINSGRTKRIELNRQQTNKQTKNNCRKKRHWIWWWWNLIQFKMNTLLVIATITTTTTNEQIFTQIDPETNNRYYYDDDVAYNKQTNKQKRRRILHHQNHFRFKSIFLFLILCEHIWTNEQNLKFWTTTTTKTWTSNWLFFSPKSQENFSDVFVVVQNFV